ncbi:MAG: hypothetical protein C5B50_07105 [Verrucomicrobia bacterium]|nr:MAG: hypothetical protein C5B50_07105 [Verrucomicrobiota bacterium]
MARPWFSLVSCGLLAFGFAFPQRLLAQEVRFTELIREEFFTQATTNRASTTSAAAHDLFGEVGPAFSGGINSVTLNSPGGQNGWSLALSNEGTYFVTTRQEGETYHLPGPAPAGAYQFQVTGSGGDSHLIKAVLPATAKGLAPLRIANYQEAQRLDASQPFTLAWDQIVGAGSRDFIKVAVYATNGDRVFVGPRQSRTETNLTINAGTLQPATNYNAEIYVGHYFSYATNSAPAQFLAEERVTRFSIKTLNPAGVFRFASAGFIGYETNGSAIITVERTQGSQGEVTVDYFSADGTASNGVNYAGVADTLDFPDGVTSQTFEVPLINDGTADPPLTVHLSLTNATSGAGLVIRPHSTLTILDADSAPGPNIAALVLGKDDIYSQTNGSTVIQSDLSVPSVFETDIHPGFPGAVTGATVQLPNGSIRQLSGAFANYQDFFEYGEDFPSSQSLNKAYPSGKYTVHIQTLNDGEVDLALTLGIARKFPVPQLTNWDAGQTIDPTLPFTLEWTPFTGATTNDYIRVVVSDPAGEYVIYTPNSFQPGALPATTTSLTIPANAMVYGNRYPVSIDFFRKVPPSASAHPAIKSAIIYVHATKLYIKTMAGPGS